MPSLRESKRTMNRSDREIRQPTERRVFDAVDSRMTASTDIVTRFGTVRLCWNENSLYNIVLGPYEPSDRRTSVRRFLPSHEAGQQLISNFLRYFNGEETQFNIPLPPQGGSEFQRALWAALLEIPYGQYETYGEIALRLKLPERRARLVGSAAAQNPLPIIYPCHRLVSATGALTGYSAGVEWKQALLELEGVPIQHERIRTFKK